MKILVAEDNPITLEALATCLKLDGFLPILANDGKEAIKLWRDEEPDLVCLDIMMPHLSGFDVCKRIREVDVEIPILFLSAKNQEVDVVTGLKLGADDFIRKPFTRNEVLARIHSILRRTKPQHEKASFSLQDLAIHAAALTAQRGAERIELTPREVKILQLLHRNQGKPVTRDALLDYCWGQDYFPDSRSLDQQICVLRKKIEPDPSKPVYIETVRAIGYRTPNESSGFSGE